ncbi:outer membrane lipoprotein carrier protein LolA [Deferribacter autotrophicus]|uniref:Outer membrane lipoprotein carrier protein LolA n=1 Tax=Deferribacter autotrophicus TaxID=500465 RepID=A0A5A8F5W9_9BACT|nr:outer membrane lipoprotein carrier protein LolA [Deferribacter autotrophicus]KAA0258510.1 outer membrane lipoprotein carrier protein LolA [Deferribacter autotrophicus]
MKIIKILEILFFCLIMVFNVFSKDISIESVLESYSNIKTFQADFVQKTTIQGFGDDYYEGKVYLIRGEKLMWDYKKPYRQYYLFEKDKMEYYDSSAKQLIRQKISLEDNVVLQIIMDISTIGKNFKIISLDKDRVRLIPKSFINLKYIDLLLGDKFIKKIISEDGAGNITEIIFKNSKINELIEDKVFKPIVPLDTEIFNY